MTAEEGRPPRPIEAGWLAQREPADTRARDAAAATLLPPLLAALPDRAPRVVDLGSGTGANLRWLAPRLPDPGGQHWSLVDHDPQLLARTGGTGTGTARSPQVTPVRADITDLAGLLPRLGRVDLVTAAALLDLLDVDQLTAVVDAVVAAQVPALFSLTVTGAVTLEPADPADARMAAAFDAHQCRDDRPGPGAGAVTAALLRARGCTVIEAGTAWTLRADREPDLLAAWIDGRAAAALEQDPGLAADVARWRGVPRERAVVGHVDLLALPVRGAHRSM